MTESSDSLVSSASSFGDPAGSAAMRLREAQARLAATIEVLPALLFVLDNEGRILDYRAPEKQLLYVPPERFLGRRMDELLPAEAVRVIRAALAETAATGRHRGGLYSLPTPAGESWFEISAVAQGDLRTPAGRVIFLARDVTAHHRAEEALRESEARARAVNDNLPGGFVYQVDTGADGQERRVTFVSQGVERLHGITAEDMMRDNAAAFYRQVHEEDRQRMADLEARAVATMTPFRAEVRFRLPSGAIRWGLVTSAPRRLPNGHLLWDGVEVDITEHKLAEEALLQSEIRFRTLYECMQDGLIVTDLEGRIMSCNPALERMIGYREEELKNKSYRDITPAGWEAVDRKAYREVVHQGFSEATEKSYVRKDGTIVPVEMSGSLLRDVAGQPIAILAVVRDIRIRKRAEAELKKSENKYRWLFESIREPFVRVDMGGHVLEHNRAYEELTGYSAAELRGLTYVGLTPKKWHALEAKIIAEQVLPNGFSEVYEKEYRRKDGTLVPIELRTTLLRDEAGQPAGMWATLRDISERKRADRFLRLVLDNVPNAVFWKDRNSVFLGCNHAVAKAAGLDSPEQIVGKTDYDLGWKKEESDFFVAMDRQVMESDRARYHIVEPQLQADGKQAWLDTCKIPLHDEEGRVIGILGTFADITERRRMERELKDNALDLERRVQARTAELEASRAALAKSEVLFRQMAESIQEVFWLFEVRTQQALFTSPSFERVWGRKRAEVGPQLSARLANIQPEDRQRVQQAFQRAMDTGEFEPIQYRIVHPDGTLRWLEDRAWAVRDKAGQVYRLAGVSRDITEHRRLESEVLKAGEAERQRIGRDLHDGLSQSLTAIGYWAQAVGNSLAGASRPEAADVHKLVEWIAKTGKQAHAMAQGLLLTDLKRGGLLPALQELALTTQEFFGVDCRYRGPEAVALPSVEVAQQLYRIAQEAATNAAKHAKGKRIGIRLAKTRAGLRLTIRDDGRGLPPVAGARAGLGLEIMNYRAGLIGATLSIQSVPGRGTRVTCLIPRAAAPRRKRTP